MNGSRQEGSRSNNTRRSAVAAEWEAESEDDEEEGEREDEEKAVRKQNEAVEEEEMEVYDKRRDLPDLTSCMDVTGNWIGNAPLDTGWAVVCSRARRQAMRR